MNIMKRCVCMGATAAMRTRVAQLIIAITDIKAVITSDGAADFAII